MREKNEKMIAANELRIGNWANNGFKDYQVSGATIWQLGLEYATALPIPLTEEWLLRFGLAKQNGYPYKYLNGFLKIRNGIFFFKYHDLEVELPFVHNFQNLNFALTGEELTIKE